MLVNGNAGGVPLSQNPYARRQLGLSPQLDPQTLALLVRAGIHVAGVNDNPGGGVAHRALRTAQPVGAPHLRTAQPGQAVGRVVGPPLRNAYPVGTQPLRSAHPASPVDLAAIGGGMNEIPQQRTAEPGPALEGGPVHPPGMPPAAPQPFDEAPSVPGIQAMPGAGGQMRLGQLGRHNAIAAQLVKRLMMHRMIGRLAQPQGMPQQGGSVI